MTTTPAPENVNWNALGDEEAWTLAHIAVPHALGLSYAEIAAQLGISEKKVSARMARLRAELTRTASAHP